MSTHAAVPGQPGPIAPKARQSAGEMGTQGAVHRRHFIIFKKDRILLVGCKAFHDQIGDDCGQMIARTVQRTAVDFGHLMHGHRHRDGFRLDIFIHRDQHFAQIDLFLMRNLLQQIRTTDDLLCMLQIQVLRRYSCIASARPLNTLTSAWTACSKSRGTKCLIPAACRGFLSFQFVS